MTPTDNFSEIKQEILDRARFGAACRHEYGRAYAAETLGDLCTVIKDNFNWCCRNGVIDAPLLEKYKKDFARNEIYVNIDTERGFLLCDGNATVEAYGNTMVEACGNATVEAWNNATVEAWDNATVEAYDNATVEAYGNATVEAYDNATVKAYGNTKVKAWNNAYCSSWSLIECKLSDNALYLVHSTKTVYYADANIKFKKQ